MSLISFTSIQNGTSPEASQVNNPLTTIYNEFNGNITAANLASNAVTTPKLAPNAATQDKIDYTSFDEVAKMASNSGTVSIPGTTPVYVCGVDITVTKETKVLVIADIVFTGSADSECTLRLRLNGTTVRTSGAGAFFRTGSRFQHRGMSAIMTLPPGTQTIEFLVFGGGGGTLSIPAGNGQISTALASFK